MMSKKNNNVTIWNLEHPRREIAGLAEVQNIDFLTSLSGIQYQVMLFFYCLIKERADQTTGPLSLARLANTLKVKKNSLRTSIMRLQKKQIIIRGSGRAGRGGWMNFKLANSLYQALNQQEALGTLKQIQTTVNKGSNTCLSSLPLPEVWRTIDYSVLNEIGFNKTHLRQLYQMQTLDALSVQNSIYHFAFDLKHNNKKAKIKGDILDYFMGILLKRTYNAPSNYIHPDIEAWQQYEQTTRQVQKQREEWEIKVQALEFKDWHEQLSDQEIKELTLEVPEAPSANIKHMLEMRAIKKYFIEEVWPHRSREILQSSVNWTKPELKGVQSTKPQETLQQQPSVKKPTTYF